MPTKLWAVRAALVDIFAASLDEPVVDGPFVADPGSRAFVLVGSAGGPIQTAQFAAGDIDDDGCSVEQTPTPGVNHWRDERGEIVCSAWAWSGDTQLASPRASVTAIVEAIELALRADRRLGGVLEPPGLAEFTGLRFSEQQTDAGAVVRAVFIVAYTAQLTT